MKKKNFRDIRNGIFMLCITLAMLSTATFAWFSMNDRVNAEGMVIKAKAASSLFIKAGEYDADAVREEPEDPAYGENTDKELYPIAHKAIANSSDADLLSNWYYDVAVDPSESTGKGEENGIEKFDNYVLINTFSITVSEGASPMNDLTATATIASEGNKAVKVLIATTEGYQEFDGSGAKCAGDDVLAATVSPDTAIWAKVYVYWDGKDTDVYTNNFANLMDTSVTIEFKATPGSGEQTP